MDNSYGARPPWLNQPNAANGYQPSIPAAICPGIDQVVGDGTMTTQFTRPPVGGFPLSTPVMPTPSSTSSYPLLGLDIPNQMFMQAMNFERMMLASGGQPQGMGDMSVRENALNGMLNRALNDSQRTDTSLDLIEQRQAMEQTRLLERFKQMRFWQQQQQELLMNQQQQQLMQLKKEQERVQGMISRQREQPWGGERTNLEMSTPPQRKLPSGTDFSQPLAGSNQSKGLPKPVMYVPPKEDEDEIKTNPDLFSDTNSNRGSQAAMEEGMFPIPDSASEASVEIGDIHVRQQLKLQQQQQHPHFQQRFNPHELDAPKKLHRSFAELETSEDFINQSYQSPTVFEKHQEQIHGKGDKPMSEISEGEESHHSENSEDDEEVEDDDDDDGVEESEDESQDNTQIEVHKSSSNLDDIPIKPGVDGSKTFEQLLEEQLRAEEERLKEEAANRESSTKPKKTFLKKGEGIARFEVKPGQKPARPRKPQKPTITASSKFSGSSTNQKTGSGSTSVSASFQKSSLAGGTSQSHKNVKDAAKGQLSQKLKGNQKSGGQTGQSSKAKKDGKVKAPDGKSPLRGKDVQAASKGTGIQVQKNKKAESIPDDASFIACLKERQKESERDMVELDEFEILEEFADNMSFCSNSSIVTKGLKGLQSDRILAGQLPSNDQILELYGKERYFLNRNTSYFSRPKSRQHQSHKVGSVSPRRALIRKLETEKQERLKKISVLKPDGAHLKLRQGDKQQVKGQNSSNKNWNNNVNNYVNNNNANDGDDDDEYETASDSTEDSDDDSSDESTDEKIEKMTSSVQVNLDDPGNSRDLHKLNTLSNFHDSLKDTSVLSTDKKLERALSYTGMTETSESRDSDSDRGIDSNESQSDDDDDESKNRDQEQKSPSKILTRKVAVKISGTSLSVPRLADSADFFSSSLNSSSFAPKMKSPIVISKEKICVKGMEFKPPSSVKNAEETKFSYHSDTDSVGNSKKDLSDVDINEDDGDDKKTKSKGFSEKKTLQFDDDNEWDDFSPQVKKSRQDSEGDNEHDKTLSEEIETQMAKLDFGKVQMSEKNDGDTPPTSKLVAKLFPKLKPQQKKQEEQDLQKVQTVTQTDVGEGVQSKVLRDKLMELEREIEKFRAENKHLAKLRTEREEGLATLKKEILAFEKEKNEELKRLEEFKTDEMKKLKHERKVFEKYQKVARAGPNKKEREEIENLKMQVSDLQEEMKKKESRWTSNNARLRAKIDQLEMENEELREEIKLLEKKRLDWMQKDRNKGKSSGQIRSSTPTGDDLVDPVINGHVHQLQDQLSDLSVASSIKSSVNLKPSHSQPRVNVHSSFPPGPRPTTSNSTTGNPPHPNKTNNINQSSKSSAVSHSKMGTQSKKLSQKTGASVQVSGQGKASAKPPTKSNGISAKGSGDKNVLRNSLNEDVPRTATFAQPQDVSMYSENGETSVHMPSNLPRKLASKMGVDKSIIDKGNDTSYEEMQHSDGKLERVYRNGAREILFSNGTRKEISADGQSIVVSFFNGDVKQIMPDQRVVYFYAEAQTTVTSYPDGLEILQFPNNQTEKLYADGTREITFPDQTVKYIFPNGSEESIFQDGTIIRLEKNGDKIMEFPNGQREIHTQDYKKREYPDGTAKTVYPDGRQETRYSNGRLRVKDKDGNVIIDRQC